MDENILSSVFYPAVQTVMPAGWSQSGQCGSFAPGRLAYAFRCLPAGMAKRAGSIDIEVTLM